MHYELTNTNVVGNAILRRYFQYLRLERSYTPNTLDAYLNFTHLSAPWRVGNLKTDSPETLKVQPEIFKLDL